MKSRKNGQPLCDFFSQIHNKKVNYCNFDQKFSHVSLHHKIGDCPEGEPCVLVGVCSPHRKELFDACDFGITELKRKVPIWKREIYFSGAISEWKENCECI